MNEAQKAAVQHNWTYMLDHIDVDNTLLMDYLYEMCVLSKHQKEEVMAELVPKDKVAKLLDLVTRKGPVVFKEFLEALDKSHQGHVADKIRHDFHPHPHHDPHQDHQQQPHQQAHEFRQHPH